jgi:hypothetical protein
MKAKVFLGAVWFVIVVVVLVAMYLLNQAPPLNTPIF